MADDPINEIPKFIRRVMPKASETELREATATFDEYMAVVWEIFQRVKRESTDADSANTVIGDKIEDIQRFV